MQSLQATPFELISTICFVLAILHTFSVKQFQKLAEKYQQGSVAENAFHLLGEVEVVFGLWAGIFIGLSCLFVDKQSSIDYLNSRNFTEAFFVFVIMIVCSTYPILNLVEKLILFVSHFLPLPKTMAVYFCVLVIGPLLGSFITEPAAMTVTALFLLQFVYRANLSEKAKYLTLGLLFVNISIGGTLTPYAAPPVLMVAGKWGWDLGFMLTHFSWRAVSAILLSTTIVMLLIQKDLKNITFQNVNNSKSLPVWISLLHILFLAMIVIFHQSMIIFVGLFLFFIGLMNVTKEYQKNLKIKESLLVAFFLAGLVVLGGPQKWWLQPLVSELSTYVLYFGSIVLTSFTDNAALTYLGSQVESITESSKFALVAGSVVGGGLTVIANAPNPAGYSILNSTFGPSGISPLKLFLGALLPTIIAAIFFFPY